MKKKACIVYTLILITLCVLDVFNLTPIAREVTYLTLFFSTLGHFYFFIEARYISRNLKIWYGIFIFLMFNSILTANIYFGQSLFSGFVANVNFYHIGAVFLFYHLFRKYNVSFKQYFSELSKVAWLFFCLYLLMAIFDYSFINESELTGNVVIVDIGKVSKVFINFIAVYYFSKFLLKSNYLYLFSSLLFFSINHWGDIQRFILLVSVFVLIVGAMISKNQVSSFKFLLPSFFAFLLIGGIFINTPTGNKIVKRFNEAYKITSFDAGKIQDVSTASRVLQAKYALDKFAKRPMLGNGDFRASYTTSVVGNRYFHLSDIGFIGVLYAFGIVGGLIYLIQVTTVWKGLARKPEIYYQFCLILSLLFLISNSLITGKSIFYPHIFMFFLVLLQLCENKMENTVSDL